MFHYLINSAWTDGFWADITDQPCNNIPNICQPPTLGCELMEPPVFSAYPLVWVALWFLTVRRVFLPVVLLFYPEFRFQTATNTILTVMRLQVWAITGCYDGCVTDNANRFLGDRAPIAATSNWRRRQRGSKRRRETGRNTTLQYRFLGRTMTKVTGYASSSPVAWFWRIRHKWRWGPRLCFVRVFTRMSSGSATGIQSAFYEIIPRLLGDPSGCSLGFVDNNTKAMFQYMLLILKHNFWPNVNKT